MTTAKKADTWMPWYVADYLADTMYLTTEQHGAYCLLLMACWKGDGRVPADDQSLSSITKLTVARWRAHASAILPYFDRDGEWLTQKRVLAERAKAKATSEKRSKAGAGGSAKRWQDTRDDDGKRIANAMANAIANGVANEKQTDTPSPSPTELTLTPPDGGVVASTPGDVIPFDSSRRTKAVPDCPHQRIVDLFCETFPQLPHPRQWTGQREAHLRARWRAVAVDKGWESEEDGIAWFGRMFAHAAKSRFLMGQVPGRDGRPPFEMTLPWLVEPENFAKVIEGVYHRENAA